MSHLGSTSIFLQCHDFAGEIDITHLKKGDQLQMYLEKIKLHDDNAVCVAVGSALLEHVAIGLSLKVVTILQRITSFNAGFKLNFVSSSLDEDNNTTIFVDVTFHVSVCMSYAD